jgi:hypothetical protein
MNEKSGLRFGMKVSYFSESKDQIRKYVLFQLPKYPSQQVDSPLKEVYLYLLFTLLC